MQSVNFKSESGSAVLEFLGFGALLQIPILLGAITLTAIQHDQFAADAINREALRSFTLLGVTPSQTASEIAMQFGIEPGRVSVKVQCEDTDCNLPGKVISLTTTIGLAKASGVALR
ncbi:MAG: hypothetical protein ACKOUD_05245 [Rhodoluna sp.]